MFFILTKLNKPLYLGTFSAPSGSRSAPAGTPWFLPVDRCWQPPQFAQYHPPLAQTQRLRASRHTLRRQISVRHLGRNLPTTWLPICAHTHTHTPTFPSSSLRTNSVPKRSQPPDARLLRFPFTTERTHVLLHRCAPTETRCK